MVTITEITWNNNVHLNPTKCSTVGGMEFTVPIGFKVGVFLVWQGSYVLIYVLFYYLWSLSCPTIPLFHLMIQVI